MERINKIIKNKTYLEYIDKIKFYERDRKFCRHDSVHFLDVCRLAEIEWLNFCLNMRNNRNGKNEIGDSVREHSDRIREFIYAAGLLHDIGRWQEYENGICHETASGQLAVPILEECGFDKDEIEEITEAILNHRNNDIKEQMTLSGFLYRGDKKSRPCYLCEAESDCNWSAMKKNLEIR